MAEGGFPLVIALSALAWLRLSPWRTSLPAAVGVLFAPAFLIAVADAYALYLLVKGCALPFGGLWRAAGLAILAIANGALALRGARAWREARRLARVVSALPLVDGAIADRLAASLPALAGVSVRRCPLDGPVLFTTSLPAPTIVVSAWVLEQLDEQELVAALAHELGHIAHGDSRLLGLVSACCPAGPGVFASARRALGAHLERRADAWAASRADRWALASALVKVSRQALAGVPAAAAAFAAQPSSVQARVQALLDGPAPAASRWDGGFLLALGLGVLAIAWHFVARLCGVSAV